MFHKPKPPVRVVLGWTWPQERGATVCHVLVARDGTSQADVLCGSKAYVGGAVQADPPNPERCCQRCQISLGMLNLRGAIGPAMASLGVEKVQVGSTIIETEET